MNFSMTGSESWTRTQKCSITFSKLERRYWIFVENLTKYTTKLEAVSKRLNHFKLESDSNCDGNTQIVDRRAKVKLNWNQNVTKYKGHKLPTLSLSDSVPSVITHHRDEELQSTTWNFHYCRSAAIASSISLQYFAMFLQERPRNFNLLEWKLEFFRIYHQS